MSNSELSVLFFLQLAVILGVCRVVGVLARYLGQPQVVAEMIAGVLMGPSLLGILFPEWQAWLFPAASKTGFYLISQVGLVLYMFLVGLEFDLTLVTKRLRSAAAVSVAGIIAPFALGAMLAWFLSGDKAFFSADVGTWEIMMFVGASMAITAFPMLARIIHERGLAGTSLGTLALAAGSIDDGVAWCLLAVVLASLSGEPMIAVIAVSGAVLYVAGLFTVGRPALKHFGERAIREGKVSHSLLTLTLIVLMVGAWFTDYIGIHAVFGAFIMGIVMPRGLFAERVQQMLQPLVATFLVPLFFVYSGLNTRINLVDTPYLWIMALGVLLVASVGKGVACWWAARLRGENQRDSLAIGTLMNTRGMMELIILNIGLERGLIQPVFFTIMVLMAIATTLMTSPLFNWIYRAPRFAPVLPTLADAEVLEGS